MKPIRLFRATALFLLGLASTAFAQERGSSAEANMMLEQAVAQVAAAGLGQAAVDFSAPGGKWHQKDLYVFAVKFDGTTLAHGGNKGLVGKNLIEVKDPDGKFFIKEMIEMVKAKGSGSVDYTFTDPKTKRMGQKTSYVVRIPNYDGLLGVGVYKQ